MPAAPSISAAAMVCTESTTKSSGATASIWPSTVLRSVSEAIKRLSLIAPVRSARRRICPTDSSPETYKTFLPDFAVLAATSSSRVLLPTPGSPDSSTTAPGTNPPPSTRSNSPTWVDQAATRSVDTSVMGLAAEEPTMATGLIWRTVPSPRPPPALLSCIVSHAWHSPQRPTHLGVVQPQSVQVKVLFATAIGQNYQVIETVVLF